MLIGDPDYFAFILERVPKWEIGGFVNGIMYVIISGISYPEELRTTTFNSELSDILGDRSALVHAVRDDELFALDDKQLFDILADKVYPDIDDERDNDYRFMIPYS